MNKKFFVIVVMNVIIIVTITCIIYFINSKRNEGSLNEKLDKELNYIGREIIDMTNVLNNISFSNYSLEIDDGNKNENNNENEDKDKDEGNKDNEEETKKTKLSYSINEERILNSDKNKIEWDYIKNHIERLYNIWVITNIDLQTLNVNNEDILNFSNTLDQTIISTKKEDKSEILKNLVNLYSCIPNILEQICMDSDEINMINATKKMLYSYMFVNKDNWDDTKIYIQDAIKTFTTISSKDNSKFGKNKVNKISILLDDINKSVSLKDKDIYLIKYKSLMEELVNI